MYCLDESALGIQPEEGRRSEGQQRREDRDGKGFWSIEP
jgi:hypothetical protein